MDIEKTKSVLQVIAIIILALGLLTLVPSPGASKPCLFGYKAKCSFTPISTAIMLVISGVLFFIRSRIGA